jgi:hypothetical protein
VRTTVDENGIVSGSDRIILFAEAHMLAAVRFSRMVGEAERSGAPDVGMQILDCATACIFASVAALEAYANEFFSMMRDVFPGYSARLLEKLWETFEMKPLLDKFQFALLLKGCPEFETGARPYQDVAVLIDLRNALVHFKPEWESEAVQHQKLSAKLRGKFAPSPLVSEERPVFPERWATEPCTTWAVNSAIDFAHLFAKKTSTIPRFISTLQTLGRYPKGTIVSETTTIRVPPA